MDLSLKIQMASDKAIQAMLQQLEYNELAQLVAHHLDEGAVHCIYRNMSPRGIDTLRKEKDKALSLVNRADELIEKESANYAKETENYYILFTDLVNSTNKLNLLGDDQYFEQVLTVHNDLITEHIEQNNGRIIKSIGDAYLVIFKWGFEAAGCCLAAQSELETINRSREDAYKIHVRMGLHKGPIQYKLFGNHHVDIYGSAVNFASRVVGFAGGEQVLVSEGFKDAIPAEKKLLTYIKGRAETTNFADEDERDYYLSYYRNSLAYLDTLQLESAGKFSAKGFTDDIELFSLTVHDVAVATR